MRSQGVLSVGKATAAPLRTVYALSFWPATRAASASAMAAATVGAAFGPFAAGGLLAQAASNARQARGIKRWRFIGFSGRGQAPIIGEPLRQELRRVNLVCPLDCA